MSLFHIRLIEDASRGFTSTCEKQFKNPDSQQKIWKNAYHNKCVKQNMNLFQIIQNKDHFTTSAKHMHMHTNTAIEKISYATYFSG